MTSPSHPVPEDGMLRLQAPRTDEVKAREAAPVGATWHNGGMLDLLASEYQEQAA